MCHTHNENWEKTNNGMNKIAKSRNDHNTWRKGKCQVLRSIGSGHYQIKKNDKNYPR